MERRVKRFHYEKGEVLEEAHFNLYFDGTYEKSYEEGEEYMDLPSKILEDILTIICRRI